MSSHWGGISSLNMFNFINGGCSYSVVRLVKLMHWDVSINSLIYVHSWTELYDCKKGQLVGLGLIKIDQSQINLDLGNLCQATFCRSDQD